MVVHLIGVPFNSAGTTAGVARAPAALRAAGLVEALRAASVSIEEPGDVALDPTSEARDPASGIIAPGALAGMIRVVRAAVGHSLRAGAFPLVIGGDCPVLLGCLAAAGEGPSPGLLFVDGHEDAWPPHASTTGEAADMELGFLLGRDVDALPADLRDMVPRVEPDRLVVVGPRDERELAEAGVGSIDGLVDVVRTEGRTGETVEAAVAARVARLDGLGPWWLHVDLDVLSTASLAAVDYPQPGGLDWPALSALTRRALSAGGTIGWSVTIYNPDLDVDGTGAAAIVGYLVDALRGRPRLSA